LQSSAGDDHPLASRGVPVILARAVRQSGWQAENLGRTAQSHRRDEPRKSLWGAPHIHGELLKLGFTLAQSTVARYMYRGLPSQAGGPF
jgi:hypothetical protein